MSQLGLFGPKGMAPPKNLAESVAAAREWAGEHPRTQVQPAIRSIPAPIREHPGEHPKPPIRLNQAGDRFVICPNTMTGSMSAEDVDGDALWREPAKKMAAEWGKEVVLYRVHVDGAWQELGREPAP